MEKHVRELYDYLKDYGATNIHLEPGAKHQKICFYFGGLERSYLVAHKPSTDHHAIENTKATLRRMLGPPVLAEEKQPRKLEEMMNELNQSVTYIGTPPVPNPPKPSKNWKVWVCGYKFKDTTQLFFYFRHGIEQLFPNGVSCKQLDAEHWKLTNGGRSKFHRANARMKVCFNVQGVELFGSTIAEAVEADGAILVYLPMAKRAKVQPHGQVVRWDFTKPTPKPAQAALTTPPASLENQMRDIIRQIQAIEATCPYHLVRLEGGRIQWRAPVIE